jgi:hypothetical protein
MDTRGTSVVARLLVGHFPRLVCDTLGSAKRDGKLKSLMLSLGASISVLRSVSIVYRGGERKFDSVKDK